MALGSLKRHLRSGERAAASTSCRARVVSFAYRSHSHGLAGNKATGTIFPHGGMSSDPRPFARLSPYMVSLSGEGACACAAGRQGQASVWVQAWVLALEPVTGQAQERGTCR